jgi:hypothetical protein
MNRADFLWFSYRLIVRMHPGPFRDRFGDEMLWIFDAERRRGRAAQLLLDGVLSLLRQHVKVEKNPEPIPPGFALLDTSLGIAPRRFIEAGLTASLILAGFMLLLGKAGKPPVVPVCLPGAPPPPPRLLQAPSRIQALPRALPNIHSRLDPRQIDNAAASAVRIARVQGGRLHGRLDTARKLMLDKHADGLRRSLCLR